MSRPRHWRYDRRARWRKSVLASPHYSSTQKLILAATADRMQPDGKFFVERREVMVLAGVRHPQRVSEAWSRAVRFGHLYLVSKMAYGQPTRYQATLPDHICNELCTRDSMGLVPPVVTGSTGHYPSVSANPVTTEKLVPPVVTGNPVTISSTRHTGDHAPDSASPGALLESRQQRRPDIDELLSRQPVTLRCPKPKRTRYEQRRRHQKAPTAAPDI